MSENPATPELDKLSACSTEWNAVRDFLEWLDSKGYRVCEMTGNQIHDLYAPVRNLDAMVHEHFELDPKKLEAERRTLIDHIANLSSK